MTPPRTRRTRGGRELSALYLGLPTRAPHLGGRPVPPSPRRGAVQRPGRRLSREGTRCGAAPARLRLGPLTPCRGGGDPRRAGRGGRVGGQVCSSTRAGRPREQRRTSGWRRRRRRCHSRCHLRTTPGSPAGPGPPRSTPLSTSGAPRRSSRRRRLTAGCSFRTRPQRPSARPGKLPAHDLQPHLHLLSSTPGTPIPESSPPSTSLDPTGGGRKPGILFAWHECNGVQRGAVWPLRAGPSPCLAQTKHQRGKLVPSRCALYLDGQRSHARGHAINLLRRGGG